MGRVWSLQDAKNKFSAVVDAAQGGEPQHVTKRGVDAVVVLSAAEYERLIKLDDRPKKTFMDHIRNFPKLPDDAQDLFDKREPLLLNLRDVDFGGD